MFVIVKWYQCFTFLPYFPLEPNSCVNKKICCFALQLLGLNVDTVLKSKGAGCISKHHALISRVTETGCNIMAFYFLSCVSFKIEPLNTTTTTTTTTKK